MKPRTTIILLCILAVVGGAWWLTRGLSDTPHQDPDDHTPEPTALFTDGSLDVSAIDRFEVRRAGDSAVFERTRGRWFLTEPTRFAADAATVNQFLQSVALLRDLGPAEGGPASRPIATVTLRVGGDTRTITFDDTVGGGLGRVRVDSAESRLVGDVLHDFLKRYDPTDLLSKQLATPNAYNTDTVVIHNLYNVRGATRLDHRDGDWFINQDPSQPALSEPVEGCIDVAGYLNIPNATKIERFVPLSGETLNPSAYGLDPASARVRIAYTYRAADGQTRNTTLSIGSPVDTLGNSYYCMLSAPDQADAVVFVLPAEFSIVMAKAADDFRDPRVFTVTPHQLERIDLIDVWSLDLSDERGNLFDSRPNQPKPLRELRDGVTALLTLRSHLFIADWQDADRWVPAAGIRVTPLSEAQPELVTFYRPVLPEDTSGLEPGFDRWLAVRGEESVGLLVPAEAIEAVLALDRLDLPFER